jgi:hypothetical protein
MTGLILKRAPIRLEPKRLRRARRMAPSFGRIFHAAAAPWGAPWMWTLLYAYQEDLTPTHGHEATREAMAAFARSGRRERKAWTGGWRPRFRTFQVRPKDMECVLPQNAHGLKRQHAVGGR